MTGCAVPGSRCWYSVSDNRRRKYAATLEIVETPDGLCSVNTGRANLLVAEALRRGSLAGMEVDAEVRAEVRIPEGNGRFDFLVRRGCEAAYVEVKSVTLHLGCGVGAFPDAVSARALKHVAALTRRVGAGDRGVLVFCAQHCGVTEVRAADHVDPAYASALDEAMASGVEVLAYGCSTDLVEMHIDRVLPFSLKPATGALAGL
jgi:sugar fermentation stimulation protein A